MLKRFLPQQENFFRQFEQAADLLVHATAEFHLMLAHLPQSQIDRHVNAIAGDEKEGDKITRQTFSLLHKTFITPFDRFDIHALTSGLDDILDLVNHCAQRFPFYNLKSVPAEIIHLASLAVRASTLLKQAIGELHFLRKSADILRYCKLIDRVESEAHEVVLLGEKKLFAEENNFKEFIKLKDIYGQTRLVINHCQDVANLIKGIVLEYA